jgi:dipeptidyl aminopeptidase/acylaminoacyl peptidase
MVRAKRWLSVVAFVGLLASACETLSSGATLSSTPSVNPSTAIAVSVLSDSIYLVDPDNGAVSVVAHGLIDFQSGYAAWTPHHARVLYGNLGIQQVNPVSDRSIPLVKGQSLSMPSVSPSGKQMVFGDGISMYVSSVTHARPETIPLPPDLAPFAFDWGPDGLIVFEGLHLNCSLGPCLSTDRSDIFSVRPDGSDLKQLTRLGTASNPKWSPDGSKILFVRSIKRAGRVVSELWTVGPNGGRDSRLMTAENVVAGDWSSDGTRLAALRTTADVNSQIEVWVADADGSGAHKVVDGIPGTQASLDW